MDRQIVIKLLSGEEIVCTLIQETDYEISVIYPMLVKHIPKLVEGRLMESIALAPYTYFASDDEFTFNKSHIIFCKDLNPKHIDSYNIAVDDFVALESDNLSVDDLKESIDKLKNIFNEESYDEIYDEPPTKALH